jgi:hypothetical protein
MFPESPLEKVRPVRLSNASAVIFVRDDKAVINFL